jgi:hypothetical protein
LVICEIRIENGGQLPADIPWTIDSNLDHRKGAVVMALNLKADSGGRTRGELILGPILWGSVDAPGSLVRLAPGETARFRFPLRRGLSDSEFPQSLPAKITLRSWVIFLSGPLSVGYYLDIVSDNVVTVEVRK